MTWFLDLRSSAVGGTLASQVSIRQGSSLLTGPYWLLEQIRGRDVLFVVHGFNVDRTEGIASLTGWEALLSVNPNVFVVGVLWPGDSRWMPVLDYPFEDSEAIKSAKLLAGFVDEHFQDAASVSFVSHSLGARVVLEVLSRLKLKVLQVVLMAGAINDDCLLRSYRSFVEGLEGVAVLASLSDAVLEIAFPLGNPLAGIITQGHPYWRGALGRYGPQSPRPKNLRSSWLIPNEWGFGHGDYLGGDLPISELPVSLPALADNPPASKPGWSAGFVSTLLR